ncbi:sodium:solute symporter family protein [Natrialbaceae archaeon AArc-T1-2]|uniref:sodium:solute symporter family protein n=1 Tax=Natrialbaceae archaeon AArc-T1-2 TaxID=3053904 RepID=UPI00255AB2B6|nr:sodium:solute symporter family protein [Natrialbaceae archaeon AArc-T1-2]WIV65911.1 sodium:solute symporter family protein [Natrialbaceae archaeon AArc-T1-2]
MTTVALTIIALYVVVTIAIGWYGYVRTGHTPAEYFLAGGTLGVVVFPLTMFATLMSAFIFLGSAGWGYEHGMGWFALLGVEVIAGIPLALIGLKVWRVGKRYGVITPTELVGRIYDSDATKLVVLVVQFVWAVPYLAIQAMGGGILFETITDGAMSFTQGAVLISVVTAVYLTLGGLRSVAWSDVLQGLSMVVLLIAALVWLYPSLEPTAAAQTLATETGHLEPAGDRGFFTPGIWLSFLLMNTMAIIAYPQMFQRFLAAEDERAFRSLLVWWPIMVVVAVLVPVLLGVWGAAAMPGLEDPDTIVPALLAEHAPPVVFGIVMGGAVAAMMSTADSLVLTLSSVVSRDLYRDHVNPDASPGRETWVGRVTAVVLLAGGLVLALARQETIIELAVYFIQGNALLLPVLIAPLYWRRVTATGALASVALGQGFFVAATFGPVPAGPFMPFVPALVLACAGLLLGSLLSPEPEPNETATLSFDP